MKYFSPEQSKLLSELGLVSESDLVYCFIPGTPEHQIKHLVYRLDDEKDIHELKFLIKRGSVSYPKYSLSDIISPSEVARENCKKLWGNEDESGAVYGRYRISQSYRAMHDLLDLSEDEVIEEVMLQAYKIKQL